MCTQNGAMDRCPKGVEFSGYPSWYGSAALCVCVCVCVCVRACMRACVRVFTIHNLFNVVFHR